MKPCVNKNKRINSKYQNYGHIKKQNILKN